jgi:hypothetical protein
MYLHLEDYFGATVVIGGLTKRVLTATMLSTGLLLHVDQRPTQTIISGLPDQSPDELVSVVKLELDAPPDQDISRVIGAADIFPDLPE